MRPCKRFIWLAALLVVFGERPLPAQTNRLLFQPPQINFTLPGALPGQMNPALVAPITPAASVMNLPLDSTARPVAHAEFDPPIIAAGSQAMFRLVVSCPNATVRLPETVPCPQGLKLTAGASGDQMLSVTGRVWRVWVYNFRAEAVEPGTFTVPSFTLLADDEPLQTPEATIQVKPSADVTTRRPMEIVLKPPERTLFVGEMVPVRMSVWDTGDGRLQNLTNVKIGGDGLLLEPNSIYARQGRSFAFREGRTIGAIETEALLTPLRAGALSLSAQAEATLAAPGNSATPLAAYRPLIESSNVVLRATNVPSAGRLPGFNGAIGRFSLLPPALSADRLRAGEPLKLSVTVRGEGNLPLIPAPLIAGNPAWQVFPPTSDPVQGALGTGIASRTFHYSLVPLTAEVTATPAIPFSYFDPATQKFLDLTVPPQRLTVMPGATNEVAFVPAAQAPGTLSESRREENEDRLRPLADSPGRAASTLAPLQMRRSFWLVQLIPAALLGGLWLWDKRRRFLAENPEVLALRRARRTSRLHWSEANAAGAAKDVPRFTAAAVRAMQALCAPQAAAHPDSLVCRDILELLPEARRDGTEGQLVRGFFAVTDGHRFNNGAVNGHSLLEHRAETDVLLQVLNEQLKDYVARCVRDRRRTRSPGRSVLFRSKEHGARTGTRAVAGAALFLALIQPCVAQQADLFQQGVAAYASSNYESAEAAFRKYTEATPASGALHNLGNAEWLRGNIGEAILAWERSAWLDPREQNSRVNLRFARGVAQLETPQFSWFESCSVWLPANAWAWIAAGSFWFAAAMLVLPRVLRWRKSQWHQALAAFGLTVFLLALPGLAGIASRAKRGVVVTGQTPVRLTPTRDGEVLSRLPAGEAGVLLRRRGNYFSIRTPGGTRGWVDQDKFRLIAE
jgi:tetratricopeptide (TPR) repeat protein